MDEREGKGVLCILVVFCCSVRNEALLPGIERKRDACMHFRHMGWRIEGRSKITYKKSIGQP